MKKIKKWLIFLGLAFAVVSACKSFDTTESAAADIELKGAYDSNYMLRLAQAEDASGKYLFETCIHNQKAVVEQSCVPTFKDTANQPVLFTLTTIELPQDLSDQEVEYLQAVNQQYDRYHAEVVHASSGAAYAFVAFVGSLGLLAGATIGGLKDFSSALDDTREVLSGKRVHHKGIRGLIVYNRHIFSYGMAGAGIAVGILLLSFMAQAEENPASNNPNSFSLENDDVTFIMDLPSDLWSVDSDDNSEVVSVEELIKNIVTFQHKIFGGGGNVDGDNVEDRQPVITIAQYCLPSLNGSQQGADSECFSA